jgi:hypothetical protein
MLNKFFEVNVNDPLDTYISYFFPLMITVILTHLNNMKIPV